MARVSCKNNSVRSSFYLVKVLVNLKMAILEFSRPEKANMALSRVYHLLCRKLHEYKTQTNNSVRSTFYLVKVLAHLKGQH